MTTATIKGLLHYRKEKWQDRPEYAIFACDMSEYDYILIGPYTVTVEVPDDFNPVAAQVASLEKKLEVEKKEHCDRVIEIERKIAELLCIENSAGAQ